MSGLKPADGAKIQPRCTEKAKAAIGARDDCSTALDIHFEILDLARWLVNFDAISARSMASEPSVPPRVVMSQIRRLAVEAIAATQAPRGR